MNLRQRGARIAQREEVQAVGFPRARFTVAEAQAWASLHGVDHGDVVMSDDWIRIDHRSRSAFDLASLHPIVIVAATPSGPQDDGIRAMVGRRLPGRRGEVEPASARLSYLESEDSRRVYELYSAILRHRAFFGASRITLGSCADDSRDSRENAELVDWYLRWFERTHEDPSEEDLEVEEAIVRGLGQATREHAREYVGKLGWVRGRGGERLE